ncbi:MAG: FAD:protein FMN transferase [Ignavibacteriae bacterium]|nr:FAD:protein FMN transferase [Ignavibacteriota bacterium]
MINLPSTKTINIHHFAHEAMATVFEVIINLDDKNYAEQAAHNVFNEIDKLENKFSRFRSNTEIAKINNSKNGEEIKLSFETFECIWIAKQIYEMTNGFFDITTGNVIDKWKNKLLANKINDLNISDFGNNYFILDELNFTIKILNENLSFDLGGIGKGYAVDYGIKLLNEWDIENAIIHGGGSSVKAIGRFGNEKGWKISLSNPKNNHQTIAEINMQNFSIGSSGKQKNNHIINPKTLLPNIERVATWVITESATIADAISTAFMLMPIDEISELCEKNNFISGLIILCDSLKLKKEDIFISDNFFADKFFI